MLALGAGQILEDLTQHSVDTPCWITRLLYFSLQLRIWFSTKVCVLQTDIADLSPTTLIGNGVIRTCENAKYMQLYPNSLSSLIGGVAVLLYSVGMSGLVGLAASALILGLNAWIATYARMLRRKISSCRYKTLRDETVIESIKAIKL